jgi:hypothetical protein
MTIPVKIRSLAPLRIEEFSLNEPLERDVIPQATTVLIGGAVKGSAAAAELADSAGTAGTSDKYATEDHAHPHGNRGGGTLHAAATPSVSGFISATDKAILDTVQSGAEQNASATVGLTPAARAVPTYDGETGAVQNFRAFRGGTLIRTRGDGQTNVADFDPSFVQDESDMYTRLVCAGSKVAGANLTPNITGSVNGAVQNGQIIHDGANLFPFMNWCEVDFYGYPHHLFKQMNGSSAGNNQVSRGYEAGQKIRKGDFLRRPGRGVRYELRGFLTNVTWQDAFAEFVLEPNVVCSPAGVFTSPNRMRMGTEEIGVISGSSMFFTFWCELAVNRAQEHSYEGEFRLYSSTGRLIRAIPWGGGIVGGFNWLQNDAKIQLRWRVDRIANLDTYNDVNQGSNQGANLLRLDVRRWKYVPIGFDSVRKV